jgi:hypothetical protein
VEPLKKTWLFPVLAGLALVASACTPNAAPNDRHPGTTVQQAVPRMHMDGIGMRNNDGIGARPFDVLGTRPFDGMGMRDYDLGVRNTPYGTDYMNNNYNAYTSGARSYNAFTDDGRRPFDGVGTPSIYRDRSRVGTMATTMPRMGFAQIDRKHVRTAGVNNVYVDREALARAVGNVTASCPGVNRSTVLVTDEEIFVGLNTLGGDNRVTKEQARMGAQSIAPRYYKVYVTDNANDIAEIARIASRANNVTMGRHADEQRSVDALIKRLGGKVDGEEMKTKGSKMTTTTR